MAKKTNKRVKEQYLTICPKCKSPDVHEDKSTLQQIGAIPTMYICNKCGHSGYTFPEVKVSQLEKFRDDGKKQNLKSKKDKNDKSEQVDTSYGKFAVRFLWKLTAPLSLVLGTYLLNKDPFSGVILIVSGVFMAYITYFKIKI